MQIKMTARLSKMVKLPNSFQTLVQTPAPDQYSQPSTFKVISDRQLGQPGDEVQLTLDLRAWVRHKQYVEKGTGLEKEFWDQQLIFSVLDCEPANKSAPSVRAAS
ncbi:hypothetical protein [uncultured Porticoccus sp.]|uniref:hypothetical protein n=1 Tax=uncultured Porticoccus sp. TaxID=1256050 RepID=UPI002605C221|nr:hypothetical protein [uncultured Porticoccus sp.]